MCALYKLIPLLALALSCRAQLTSEQCEPLTKTLPASEMHKIYGHWVLVAAFADFEAGLEMIGNISTSHVDLSLNRDKQTVHYHEMNQDTNGACVSRSSDATVVKGESAALTLRVGEFVKEQGGVQSKHNADADVVFYQTCPNCLVRIYQATYSGQEARLLLFYRRKGKHMEVEKLRGYEESIKKQAECLKFLPDPHYMYDGKPVTTNCRAEPTPEECEPLTQTLPASEMHTIYGHWVLVAAFADFEAGLEMIDNISTSHLVLAMNDDKQTVHYHEINKGLNGACMSRTSDATVVKGESAALTLHVGEFVKEQDGVQSKHNADADVVFYQTCPNCLVRIYQATYSGQEARLLLFYRREGEHQEVEKLRGYEESIKKKAECLKFLPDPHYMYDGTPVTTSCRAEPTPEECEPLTKTLPASEMHTIFGHWVLAAAFADFEAGLEMIGNISTSHLDLSLNEDMQTVHYQEINKDLNAACVSRTSDATVVIRDITALTLHIDEFVKEQDGVQSKHNADADVVFYQTCPNCLVRIYQATYSGQEARLLLFYRREGKHQEIEKLRGYEESIKTLAECLKFLPDPYYMYDGTPVTTSCRAEPTPEECEPLTKTLPASEMHTIYGHWLLVAAFADFEAGLEMIGNISTSHLDLSLNDDKQTVHYHEINDLHNVPVCVGRTSDATVVNGETTACTLHVGEFVKEQDGVQSKHNADADVVFYQTCPNCLVRIYQATYSGQEARFIFFYRREGQHLDIETLIAKEEYMKKQAQCLKFIVDPHYLYDGKPEVCSQKA